VPVPVDRDGMRLDALRLALARPARLIYTVPTFHNPTGAVMSAQRRHELAALAHERGIPVVEDDYLREVRFGSSVPPPLAAFDQNGNVIHLGSFSKSLLPTFRLGYVVVRGPLREQLLSVKRAADGGGSALMQRALAGILQSGALARHWKRASRIYRRRQAAMAAALRRHLPPGARWTAATGGVLMWVRVPNGVSVDALLTEATAAGVNYAPGSAFFVTPNDQPFIRLTYAVLDEPDIERGIATLGRVMAQQLSEGRMAS
jgi:DNA-binding transcriptional MocR family regulator